MPVDYDGELTYVYEVTFQSWSYRLIDRPDSNDVRIECFVAATGEVGNKVNVPRPVFKQLAAAWSRRSGC